MFTRMIRKALKSACRFKIAAMGVNHRGEVVGVTFNSPRFCRYGGGNHAEIMLMKRYGRHLETIYICRVSRTGKLLPIVACGNCKKKAEELGIKIISIENARVLQERG